MKMRNDFLWGGSVSAHQTEGATGADYGMGLTLYDIIAAHGGRDYSAGIDTYHHFKEDAKLFKELGLNAYRFSIAWARILPSGEGEVNEEGLKFYDEFIDALIENGIEPIICLYHFDIPWDLQAKYNGWVSRHVVDCFENYTRICMKRFGDRVKYWIPMNEQNWCPMVSSLFLGADPKDIKTEMTINISAHHMALAAARVVKAKEELVPNGKVLGMVNATATYPLNCKPESVLAATKMNVRVNYGTLDLLIEGHYNHMLFEEMKERGTLPAIEDDDLEFLKRYTCDAIAFSYYSSSVNEKDSSPIEMLATLTTQTNGLKNPYLTETEWGWTIDPVGLRTIANDLYNRYNKPLYILESGIGVKEELNENNTVEDDYRIEYIREHVKNVKAAIEKDHVDLRSYIVWAPIDILSSQGEMKKRYGFIYVNRTDNDLKDMKRYKKKSFEYFSKLAKSNGEEL